MFAAASSAGAQTSGVPYSEVADSARRAPAADLRIPYGSASSQFAELRLPRGAGPHPVVLLIHGGCWLNAYGLDHVAGIAESMRQNGIAVYSVEYRRVGDAGAGVPGTFHDIRTAFDSLRALAPRHALDLSRVVLMGHSAGGHLALWLGSEPTVRVNGIVALAGVTDLAAFAAPTGCGSAVTRLMGGLASERGAEYAAAAPISRAMPPAGTRVVLITADGDRIVPAAQAEAYVARSPRTQVVRVPGGHFDLVAPWTAAWTSTLTVTIELLGAAERRFER
jgi:acetyl esterase/lipase